MLNLPELGNQFENFVPGRVLIFDADGPAYAASATSKTVPTALRKFQTTVLEQMFLTGCSSAHLHLTASTSYKNGRFNCVGAKPYQGNRAGKSKPPILEATRQAIANPQNWLKEYDAVMHHVLEADDGMMIDAYRLKEHGVIWSEDKDLRMTPWGYFEKAQCKVVHTGGEFGDLFRKFTEAGVMSVAGYGRKFFWAQMLMGDKADHIQGVHSLGGKLCGPAATFAALDGYSGESVVANIVLDAYRAIDQNPLPEAYMLWLLRDAQDHVVNYLQTLQLSYDNAVFLNECHARPWFNESAHDRDSE